jgi:two-component system response regulator TctD
LKILVIEDNEDVAFAICERMRSRGYHIEHSNNGSEGTELGLHSDYDCIVLDINLPGVDGFEVLSSLRTAKVTTPVLVLTARDQLGDKVDMLDLGADDYMVKPFALDELEARLRAISRRQSGGVSAVLQVGALFLDQAGRAVSFNDEPIDMGPREVQLLEYLMQHSGTTVLKETLVSKLFGYGDVGSPNAVELLISRVRKKLSNTQVQIHTQRGVGYQLRLTRNDPA